MRHQLQNKDKINNRQNNNVNYRRSQLEHKNFSFESKLNCLQQDICAKKNNKI